MRRGGFTLIELMVVVAIIAILAGIILVSLSHAKNGGYDARRETELAQIGQFLKAGCFTPSEGPGDYDLASIIPELKAQYPQFASDIPNIMDPSSGTSVQTNYHYIISAAGTCALYANLQNESAAVTLPITTPTPGGGTGIFQESSPGWNGSTKFYQVSS